MITRDIHYIRQLIIVRGIPGSGKTTLATNLLSQFREANIASEMFEADQYFLNKNNEYVFDRNKLCDAHQYCQDRTYNSLKEGKTVIVSNTFTLKSELLPYFNMIKAYEMNPTVILAQSEYGSIHGVPEATLLNMRKRFQYDISSLFGDF